MAEDEMEASGSAKKAKIDWRDKCILKFKLQPVPESWHDQVSRGSQTAWETYFKSRNNLLKKRGDEEDDDEGEVNLLRIWKGKLDDLAYEIFQPEKLDDDSADEISQSEDKKWRYKWRTSLRAGNLEWEDCEELRSAEYYGYVWSPYAIPHAIHLEQRHHQRTRQTSVEFSVVWGYKLLDFEEPQDEDEDEEFTTICSDCFEDEELRADIIDASNLNRNTVHRLRRFLFGTSSHSEQTCDDFSFLRLLFGSMGTFDHKSLMGGYIGYSWSPHSPPGLRKKMIDDGVIEEDDYPQINWLEYSMRQAAAALRPIDNYYTAPTIKDAMGYVSPEECDSDYY
jgi:regulator of RNase E activity RraB